jgi:hypothetical protein
MDAQVLNLTSVIVQTIETIVIIISAIYIGIQLRDTRISTAGASVQGVLDATLAFYNAISSNSKIALTYIKGRQAPDSLKDEEKAQFFFICAQWFLLNENIFIQNANGILPDSYLESWSGDLRENMKNPGFRWYWHMAGMDFVKELRDFINPIVEEYEKELASGKSLDSRISKVVSPEKINRNSPRQKVKKVKAP